MTFKSILMHLDVDASPEGRFPIGLELAARFDAKLRCVSAAAPFYPMETGTSSATAAEIVGDEIDAIRTRQRDLYASLTTLAPFRHHVDWHATIADPTRNVVEQSCGADLVVLFRLDKGQLADDRRTLDIATVLLEAGRPIFVPATSRLASSADCVVIAWKNSREARRATLDAMPLLRQARDVVILGVEDGGSGEIAFLDDVIRMLSLHGVRARGLVKPKRSSVALAIIETAVQLKADILVAGGYGHSRLREWAFGGVTRTLLKDCPIDLFISN
ncbi:universal stress protein [Rhizobium sp. BK376]|uniref:universal stress protein n=1 Tax=Rhizobium sp. BK376 TaxID=2512149 RepID=UPI0010EBD183|nr:universal stress protein [Rhizobium sp. BK376]TCR75614.1 universal stress protein family protein [Rhizobium sp. BK376]